MLLVSGPIPECSTQKLCTASVINSTGRLLLASLGIRDERVSFYGLDPEVLGEAVIHAEPRVKVEEESPKRHRKELGVNQTSRSLSTSWICCREA